MSEATLENVSLTAVVLLNTYIFNQCSPLSVFCKNLGMVTQVLRAFTLPCSDISIYNSRTYSLTTCKIHFRGQRYINSINVLTVDVDYVFIFFKQLSCLCYCYDQFLYHMTKHNIFICRNH